MPKQVDHGQRRRDVATVAADLVAAHGRRALTVRSVADAAGYSTTVQFQYYREPVEGDLVAVAEEKRTTYEAVVRDEDCATIFGINDALAAIGDGHVVFGRNESGNQHLHDTIRSLTKQR